MSIWFGKPLAFIGSLKALQPLRPHIANMTHSRKVQQLKAFCNFSRQLNTIDKIMSTRCIIPTSYKWIGVSVHAVAACWPLVRVPFILPAHILNSSQRTVKLNERGVPMATLLLSLAINTILHWQKCICFFICVPCTDSHVLLRLLMTTIVYTSLEGL